MNSPEKAILRGALDALAGAGFARSGLWARATTPELTILIEFQRSQYAARYFLNVGFWIHALGTPPSRVAIHKCHYYGRAGEGIADALSFQEEYEGDRLERIRSFLVGELSPELASIHRAKALAQWIREAKLTSAIVLPEAQSFLGTDT